MSGADILFEHKLAAFRVDSFGEEFHEFSQAQNKNKKDLRDTFDNDKIWHKF